MFAGFPCFQCYGQQQCHTRLDQTASDRWPTRPETEGRCFARSGVFSCELQSASWELKGNDDTERRKIHYFVFVISSLLGETMDTRHLWMSVCLLEFILQDWRRTADLLVGRDMKWKQLQALFATNSISRSQRWNGCVRVVALELPLNGTFQRCSCNTVHSNRNMT